MGVYEKKYDEEKFWEIAKCLDYLNGIRKEIYRLVGDSIVMIYQRKDDAKVAGIRDGSISIFPSENRILTDNLKLNSRNLRELLFN